MKNGLKRFLNCKPVRAIGPNRVVLLCVMIFLCLLFQLFSALLNRGNAFLTYERAVSAVNYGYFIGFMGLGATFVIATGGIDFSIGPVMFTAALISGYCFQRYNLPMGAALLLCPLIGMIFGCVGGFLVSYLRLPSFITSLGLMQIAKGIGSLFTKTQNVSWPAETDPGGWFRKLSNIRIPLENGRVFNLPTGLLILIAVAVLCAVILNTTRAGRYMVGIGSNREAVRLSGVDTRRWEMLAYVICGTLAGFAAIFYVGCYTTVIPGRGDTFNNEVIAACVMGGTSMSGGVASILGTLIGSLMIAIMQEGILSMGLSISFQYALTALILIAVVFADIAGRRRKN